MTGGSAARDVEAIRRALEEVRNPNARYHLRQALQYAVAAKTDNAES